MDHKDYLRQLIDHTVAGKPEEAEKAFKKFIVPRSADVLNGPPEKVKEPDVDAPDVEPDPE
jgi:hypothetical protein